MAQITNQTVSSIPAIPLDDKSSSKKLILDAKGPGEIKASDITPVTDIEILNPEIRRKE